MNKITKKTFYYVFWAVKKLRILGSLSIRLTKITGKSRIALHPKHLVQIEKPWYLKHLNKSDRVLDIGSGNGQHSLLAAKQVKFVIGLDIREKQVRIANESAKERKITNVNFNIADAEKKLPYKSGSFNKILFLDVLEHMNYPDEAMNEVKRVLKKGGLLLLSIPNSETSWKRRQRDVGLNSFTDPDHKREYSKIQSIELIKKSKLAIQSIDLITYDFPFAPIIDLVGGFSLPLYLRLSRWKTKRVFGNPEETIGFRIVAKK